MHGCIILCYCVVLPHGETTDNSSTGGGGGGQHERRMIYNIVENVKTGGGERQGDRSLSMSASSYLN